MDKTIELIIIILLLGIMAEIFWLVRPRRRNLGNSAMLVDTSVLMDGRVVDLAKTGFLLGKIIVPRSVLAELQLLADGADHAKRERARFGMDAMKELKDVLGSRFILLQDEQKTPEGVDNRLLDLAKQTDSAILTIDYNLNKVAQVEGVKVLNINELAKSLRMSYLPGDQLDLELTQKGQDSHQAIGHLKDGTMVVVEQAKKFIGQTKKIEIVRSLQTDAGKMMFAKIIDVKSSSIDLRHTTSTSKRQSQGRKPRTEQSSKSQAEKNPSPRKVHKVAKRQPKTSAQREAELINLVNKQ